MAKSASRSGCATKTQLREDFARAACLFGERIADLRVRTVIRVQRGLTRFEH